MIDLANLTEFLGWCTLLNYAVLVFSALLLVSGVGNWAKRLHGKLFNLSETELNALYFSYLANYKVAIFVLNLVPYLALKIIA